MSCEVCGAHPTWFDLTECEQTHKRQNCPWSVDPGRPIPPLPDSERRLLAPKPKAAPASVKPHSPVLPVMPVTFNSDEPQPHSIEAMSQAIDEAASPKPAPPPASSPNTGGWGSKSFLDVLKDAPEPVARPKQAAKPTAVALVAPARAFNLNTTQLEQDWASICSYMQNFNWSGDFGGSVMVQTTMGRKTQAGHLLRNFCKQELHDQVIDIGQTHGRRIFFYVTALCPSGKRGFRITGHSHQSGKLSKSVTHGVLHVDSYK